MREGRPKSRIPRDTKERCWVGGGEDGDTERDTREKEIWGRERTSRVKCSGDQGRRIPKFEHHKADALGKAENEDRGQDFQLSHVIRGRTPVERRWQRTD